MFYVKVYKWSLDFEKFVFFLKEEFSFDEEDEMYAFISNNIKKGLEFCVGVY